MRDTSYYMAEDIIVTDFPNKKDFTTYKAELKNIKGEVVQTDIIEMYLKEKYKAAGYIITDILDEVTYDAKLDIWKNENDFKKQILKSRYEEFIVDISKNFNTDTETIKEKIKIYQTSINFFLDDTDERRDFMNSYGYKNDFDIIIEFISKII